MSTDVAPSRNASNTELLRWAFARLNAHEVNDLRPFWTADTIEYFPDATCQGPDEIAAYFEDKFAGIEGFALNIVSIVEAGDDAFVHWKMTGRHTGPLLGVSATGKEIAVDGIDHFVLRDQKIISNTVLFDQMAFARQVGLLPPDGSPADRALKSAFNARTKVAARVPDRVRQTAGQSATRAWESTAPARKKAREATASAREKAAARLKRPKP